LLLVVLAPWNHSAAIVQLVSSQAYDTYVSDICILSA